MAAAKEKAQLLAEENSLRLGDAVQVFDESFHASRSAHADDPFGDLFSDVPAPRAEGAPGRGALAAPAPDIERPGQRLNLDQLAPGQVAFSATVTVVYELAKP